MESLEYTFSLDFPPFYFGHLYKNGQKIVNSSCRRRKKSKNLTKSQLIGGLVIRRI